MGVISGSYQQQEMGLFGGADVLAGLHVFGGGTEIGT